jgi:plastocyanin
MKGTRLFLSLAVVLLFVLLPAVPAHAGGGCHDQATRDVIGTRVDLKGMCFVQTTLRVKPGQAVTWKNFDSMDHMVTGAGVSWGSLENLHPGQSATYRFAASGTYPYACMIHAGMVGAVVVGNGGRASGTESSGTGVLPVISSSSPAGATSEVGSAPSNPVSASSPGPWRMVALVTLGLLVAAAAGVGAQQLGLRRSRARAPGS